MEGLIEIILANYSLWFHINLIGFLYDNAYSLYIFSQD